MTEYSAVINYWFEELSPKDQFKKNNLIDTEIKNRFGLLLEKGLKGELYHWRESDLGRLAEIIILDQFTRNIFRDNPKAFSGDPIALTLAQEAVALKVDQKLDLRKRTFLYMPFMHSESKIIHDIAVKLFSQPGLEFNLDFEIKHKEIIDRFGRFPHRNKVLGRESTSEEIEFLKGPNSAF